MKCQCIDCSETPDPKYWEQYRHETEVREVMRRFGTKERIKAYLEGIEKKRGFEAYKKLRDDILKTWRK